MAVLRESSGLTIDLLENGSVFAIRHAGVLVNQVLGSPLEGGLGSLWLRRRTRAGVAATPILGPGSDSRFRASEDGATWDGSVDGLDYACTLRLAPDQPTWSWTIQLSNTTRRRMSVDAILAQDLGIAAEAAVRTSELYTSQYIDHTVLVDEEIGFVLCSRQNLPQDGAHPWILHACPGGSVGFLTDGRQFHGLASKMSGEPAAPARRTLPNRVVQDELALPTLQARPVRLAAGATAEISFVAAFVADHPEATAAGDLALARAAVARARTLSRAAITGAPRPRSATPFDHPLRFASRDLDQAELQAAFGRKWRHAERRDGRLLSFFHGRQQHVVLQAKELVQRRPTGHIARSGRELLPTDETLAVTAWMFGVFASQLVVGNTSFHKLLSVCRSPLNLLTSGGLRILVRTRRGLELLAMPSAFEMGPAGARWLYRGQDISLMVELAVSLDEPACRLTVTVERGGPLELVVSANVVVGEHEFGPVGPIVVDQAAGRVQLRPAPDTELARRYPDAAFALAIAEPARIAAIGGDGLLHGDGAERGGPYVVIRTEPVDRFSVVVSGDLLDGGRAMERAVRLAALAGGADDGNLRRVEDDAVAAFWFEVGGGIRLAGGSGRWADDLARLDDAMRWSVHDALIHASAPHGLEQSGGAAWGLRDVCQGPTELFVATGHGDALRATLRIVYEHQDPATGDWPQWFMLDRHRAIRAADSHGDIIHWPIKALCDYVEATNDLAILDEQVAWTDAATGTVRAASTSILDHVERQLAAIERSVIPGTALPVFAGGDWEDTLQPVDAGMASRLVSAWTVELAWQTLGRLRRVCERAGRTKLAARLAERCDRIRADFQRHLVPDGVVAGLAEFGPNGTEYYLHPRDRRTGVDYRLLPMTRGMISGIFSREEVERHADLIERHLRFPDGVRLMNRPMAYRGGPSVTFQRAESAATFGREIGLQYVHAHIRYIEAMAAIGRPAEGFRALLAICPILLERDVPSALPRQSNAFFSSSDADFVDRHEASRRFEALRTGRIAVKGGWRVYSSGPGILLNQLVSNVLGLRSWFDEVVFDPVLPHLADGLTFDVERDGRAIHYRYHVTGQGWAPTTVVVNGRTLSGRRTPNPYRDGGLAVPRVELDAALDRDRNQIDIHI